MMSYNDWIPAFAGMTVKGQTGIFYETINMTFQRIMQSLSCQIKGFNPALRFRFVTHFAPPKTKITGTYPVGPAILLS